MPPPVAVTVMVGVPVAARRLTVTVIFDVPAPPLIGFGLKLTETLDGTPEAERLTDELNPPETVVVSVELPDEPRAMISEVGLAVIEKSGVVPGTVTLTVVVATVLSDVPVTVIG